MFKANKTHHITKNKKLWLIPILHNGFSVVVMSGCLIYRYEQDS